MFIVDLQYIRPMEEVDAVLEAHVEYLSRQYEAGVFIASGRKVPRTGGVILARAESREHLQAVLAEDPFNDARVALYSITEFSPTMTASGLERLID